MIDDLLEKLDAEHRELLALCGGQAAARRERAYLVGGSVRDLILGRTHDDLDIVVEGDGLAVAQGVARSVKGELTRHHAFQTATVTTREGLRVDVATARREDYPRPGQLPQVVPGSLQEDLARRDFTINTMAISLQSTDWGAFVDPLGGLADLRSGRIRVMHSRSFADDPTRVLRALRFALRFGFEIDETTREWLREAVSGGYLADVSGARVRKEMRLSFTESPLAGPLRLQTENVLPAVHPGLTADAAALQNLQEGLDRCVRDDVPAELHWILVLTCCAATLPPQERWELVRRLRLSREERAPLIDAGAPWRRAWNAVSSLDNPRSSDIERALRPLSAGALLAVAAVRGPGNDGFSVVWRYLEDLCHERPQLTGAALLGLGVPEGPLVGAFLENLRAARLDGEVESIDDERRMVRAWLAEKPR